MTPAGQRWTREKPTVAGWYWRRTNAKDEKPWVVKVQRLDMGMMQMWCIGCDRPVIIGDGGEFLGPLTPDSYQQGRVAGLNLACIAVSQFSSDGEPIDANELRIALVQLLGELAKQQ